jgi:flagellar biogenesis protein FliO
MIVDLAETMVVMGGILLLSLPFAWGFSKLIDKMGWKNPFDPPAIED